MIYIFVLLIVTVFAFMIIANHIDSGTWETRKLETLDGNTEFIDHNNVEYGKGRMKLRHLDDGEIEITGMVEEFNCEKRGYFALSKGKYTIDKKSKIRKVEK